MTEKEMVRHWFDIVWYKRNSKSIYDLFIPSGITRGFGDRPIIGPKEFEGFQQAILNPISDVNISIDKAFEDCD